MFKYEFGEVVYSKESVIKNQFSKYKVKRRMQVMEGSVHEEYSVVSSAGSINTFDVKDLVNKDELIEFINDHCNSEHNEIENLRKELLKSVKKMNQEENQDVIEN